jgi:hypothetical protein
LFRFTSQRHGSLGPASSSALVILLSLLSPEYAAEIKGGNAQILTSDQGLKILSFAFIEITPTTEAMIWLHSLTAKDFNFTFRYEFRATAMKTSYTINMLNIRFRFGRI